MQKDFKKHSLCIDHFDSHQQNNTSCNLSAMTTSQNSRKRDFAARIRYPFFMFGVHHNGKYKIVCGRVLESGAGVIDPAFDAAFILCGDAQGLNDFLRTFLETTWEDGLSPAQNLKDNPDAICFQDYFGDFGASQIRAFLMEQDDGEFTIWERKSEDNDEQKSA